MSTFRRTTVVTCVAVASFSWFGRAEAATVSVRESAKSFAAMPGLEIAYAAGNGERNRVVVRSAFAGSPWTITDSGATITAGPGCTTTGPHAASCRSTPSVGGLELLFADLWLGDLDDEATIVQPDLTPAFPLYVAGGAGDDVLTVGDPYGELYGGPGDDLLTSTAGLFYGALLDGGGGHDRLQGGQGEEVLVDGDLDSPATDAPPVSDVIDGGLGRDTLSYERRTGPVAVDLTAGFGGAASELDALTGIENVFGGRGDDRLTGNDAPNTLDGQGGIDTLTGRGDEDTLVNGEGFVSCGKAADVIFGAAFDDVLARDCEWVSYSSDEPNLAAYPERVSARAAHYPIQCRHDLAEGFRLSCSGRITLKQAAAGGARLGRGTFPRGKWSDRRVRVVLTRAGRRLASRRHGVLAIVRLAVHDAYSPPGGRVERWTIRLMAPR